MRYTNQALTGLLSVLLLGAGAARAQQPPPAPGGEPELIAVLKSDAPTFDKAKACQKLAVVGTKAAVPVLAGLLADEALSHYARFALEPIPDPTVDAALRDALGKLHGVLRVGVINSIGERRDAQAVDALKRLLDDADPALAAAASAALGRIGTPESVAALREALDDPPARRVAAADALLAAADRLEPAGKLAVYDTIRLADLPEHLKVAGLSNAIRARGAADLPLLIEALRSKDEAPFRAALGAAHELPGDAVTRALVQELPNVQPAARQALVIHVLGDRRDPSALSAVLEAARGGPGPVRLAAVAALATIGDASVVRLLVMTATEGDGDVARAAQSSLAEMPGAEVDAALAEMLGLVNEPRLPVLIELVGRRGIASAVPRLLELADSSDATIRMAAVAALGSTVGFQGLPALVDRLVDPKSRDAGAAAKEALKKACQRMPDREATAAVLIDRLAGSSKETRSDLLDLLGVLGGSKALEAVAVAAKGDNPDDQDAATRVLGTWMSPAAAPVLLELSRTGPEKFRVRTLRGYLRIARQLDVPPPERIAMSRRALEAAQRDQEKALALEVLARYPSAASLAVVVPYLDDPALKAAAGTAAVTIAEKPSDAPRAQVAEAMRKVLKDGADGALAARAKAVLDRAEAPRR